MNAGILGLGRYLPDKIVTNADLEKLWTLLTVDPDQDGY